jgi:hypothetical protein
MSLAAFLISAHGFYTMSKPEKKSEYPSSGLGVG